MSFAGRLLFNGILIHNVCKLLILCEKVSVCARVHQWSGSVMCLFNIQAPSVLHFYSAFHYTEVHTWIVVGSVLELRFCWHKQIVDLYCFRPKLWSLLCVSWLSGRRYQRLRMEVHLLRPLHALLLLLLLWSSSSWSPVCSFRRHQSEVVSGSYTYT